MFRALGVSASLHRFESSLTSGARGDPHRMTLYGQSSGAWATLFYGYANPENPIVSGLIASSVGTVEAYPTNVTRFHNLAQLVGCANLTNVQELACMQSIPAVDLQAKMLSSNWDPNPGPIQPVADGVTVFANMTDRLARGLVARIVSSLLDHYVPSFAMSGYM
jgi:carboxylesterase type B